jgi:Prokaryotic N-terminal methylation motif
MIYQVKTMLSGFRIGSGKPILLDLHLAQPVFTFSKIERSWFYRLFVMNQRIGQEHLECDPSPQRGFTLIELLVVIAREINYLAESFSSFR